jgi:hypothetical protein
MHSQGEIEPLDPKRRIWRFRNKFRTEESTRVRTSRVSLSIARMAREVMIGEIMQTRTFGERLV